MMGWEVFVFVLVMVILGGLGIIFGVILGVFVYESLYYGIEYMI